MLSKYTNEVVAFTAGFLVMALEIAGARALYPLFGSSLLIWTTIIGFFMIALAVGYYIGGRLKDGKKLGYFLIVGSIFTLFFLPFVRVNMLLPFSFIFLYALWISIPAGTLAMVSPYLVGLLKKEAGEAAGYIYSISTIGSIAGTFIVGFFFLPYLGVSLTLGLVGLASSLLGYFFSRHPSALLSLILLAIFLPGITYGIPTYFHTARIVDKGELRFLVMDNMFQSATNTTNLSQPIFEYMKIMFEIAKRKGNASDIAIIGAGGCSQLHQMRFLFPSARIYVVDIDAKVFDICKTHFFAERSNPIFVLEDGRRFLAEHKGAFDIVVVDAYGSGCSIPSHLITKEFFETVRESLKPNGLFMMNIILNDDPFLNLAIKHTISYSFPSLKEIPCSPRSPRNVVFYAYKTPQKGKEEEPIITDDKNPVEMNYAMVCLS